MVDEVGSNDGKKSTPKFSEILRRPRGDTELSTDSPDISFVYSDTDSYDAEIAELYSYTEENEFPLNKASFDTLLTKHYGGRKWSSLSKDEKRCHVMRLVDTTEVSDRQVRLEVTRGLLYLCQGNFSECSTRQEHDRNVLENVRILYECGAFHACLPLLNIEIEAQQDSSGKSSICISDSLDLRIILNIMYTMLETIRHKREEEADDMECLREDLRNDLLLASTGEDSLVVTLFSMVTRFCSGSTSSYPIKKILLLLWKVVLVILGGLESVFDLKNHCRVKAGLPPITEDTHEVCKQMRASSPPASAADLIEQHQQGRRKARGGARKRGITKQTSLEDLIECCPGSDEGMGEGLNGSNGDQLSDEEGLMTPPRPASPQPAKGLPWVPKVRQRDLENFLEQTRSKFVGFYVKNDRQSLAGLPLPIHESVNVLKQHLYVSLGELQTKQEDSITKNPLSMSEGEVEETPAELLYQVLYPSLPQYMIALLKILLAAAPTSKAKTESVNILSDLMPREMPYDLQKGGQSVLYSMKLGIDANRHKEVIVKSISSLILILLKHFKLNHIYQFEYMSQHLVFANCIPLILKFFNQNITSHVCAKNSIPIIDYPSCVIGDQHEITAETLESGDNQEYCWRNLFSCINLLRILNKLTKWKHSRTMMLVVFKSAPILKRTLKVRQPMMQLYVLKLLKIQTKYLGRQWRKSNMKTLSAIYQKVRHRLTDDWAYGNDMDARPWDFQAEECSLRACVERFNSRRYQQHQNSSSQQQQQSDTGIAVVGLGSTAGGSTGPNQSSAVGASILYDFSPVDNRLQSVLGHKVELSKEFKDNYEEWLEREVFLNKIDWSKLLASTQNSTKKV